MIHEDVWLRATLLLPSWVSATADREGRRITLGFQDATDAPRARAAFFEVVGGSWRVVRRESHPHLELVTYERVVRK